MNSTIDEGRVYLGMWDDVFHHPGARHMSGSSIMKNDAYDLFDISAISSLEIGELWVSEVYGEHHVIARIE